MVDPNVQDELRRAIELMFFGYRAFTDLPDRLLERRGLGRAHHRILWFVGRNPQVSVGGLLEILGVSKQALAAPLRQLGEMGLVLVEAGDADRRVKRLSLTSEGRTLEAELTRSQAQILAAAFGDAGLAGQAGWTRVMERLAGIAR